MAGIVGIFRPSGLTPEDYNFVDRVARTLDYTGVSHYDAWADSFLSVCRVHHPHQPPLRPAVHSDLGVQVFVDGEIFDVDGVAGRVQSGGVADQSLVEAFTSAGDAGFARLNGHFAVLLYDVKARTLRLVSDRFAARPMHYRIARDWLAFGTQARSLLSGNMTPRPNLAAITQYFAFEAVLDDTTFVEGIRKLPPASVLSYPERAPSPRRYWTMAYQPDRGGGWRPHVEALAEALRGAIRRQTRDTAGLGLLLSGGMDSRAILALAASPLTAITLADFDNREVRLAREIAGSRSVPFVFVQRNPDFYGDLVDLAVDLGDGAYRFDHAHFAGITRDVPPAITTVVSGYGFDSIIKGLILPKKLRHVLGWAVNKHDLLPFPKHLSAAELVELALRWGPLADGMNSPILRLFAPGVRTAAQDALRGAMTEVLKRTANQAPSTIQWYESLRMNMMAMALPHFLNVLSIRHFFRDRTPAFDNAILDAYLAAPPRLRLDSMLYKRALRRIAPEMLGFRDANTGLRPDTHYLVEHLHHRARLLGARLGLRRPPVPRDPIFSERSWPDMGELIRHRPAVGGRLADMLADPEALPPDLFDVAALEEMLSAHLSCRADFTYLLLQVLTFGAWFRRTFHGASVAV
jgi:asparagine synthase (glutamine-hydrolysing)